MYQYVALYTHHEEHHRRISSYTVADSLAQAASRVPEVRVLDGVAWVLTQLSRELN